MAGTPNIPGSHRHQGWLEQWVVPLENGLVKAPGACTSVQEQGVAPNRWRKATPIYFRGPTQGRSMRNVYTPKHPRQSPQRVAPSAGSRPQRVVRSAGLCPQRASRPAFGARAWRHEPGLQWPALLSPWNTQKVGILGLALNPNKKELGAAYLQSWRGEGNINRVAASRAAQQQHQP